MNCRELRKIDNDVNFMNISSLNGISNALKKKFRVFSESVSASEDGKVTIWVDNIKSCYPKRWECLLWMLMRKTI